MGASAQARMNLFPWRRRTCSYAVQAQSDRNGIVVFDRGWNKGVDGSRGGRRGWGTGKGLQSVCLVGGVGEG